MELGLTDRVFVVTAASSGLGFAAAEALVAEGARVVIVARTRVAEASERLGGIGKAIPLALDLADPDTADIAVAQACDAFGRLDGAFVSVGGPPAGTLLSTTDDQWSQGFESVFLAALRVARATLGVNPAARLGFVLSTSSKVPLPQMAISNGLRPGLAMLVKQLADEIGPDGGRTFALLPGAIATQRMIELTAAAPDPAAARAAREATIPLRRYGEPSEVGRVAAFLLSDAASYLTGLSVPVDGGSMRAL